MANLGFVGLGVMGGNMVARLLDKGHTVTGYNRTRAKAQWLIDRGMKWADSPRAVSTAADFTFSMVTNASAMHSITEGPDGLLAGLGAGKILDRHEHGEPIRQPRAGGQSAREGRGHDRLARVRQRDHFAGRQAVGHGRRTPRNV